MDSEPLKTSWPVLPPRPSLMGQFGRANYESDPERSDPSEISPDFALTKDLYKSGLQSNPSNPESDQDSANSDTLSSDDNDALRSENKILRQKLEMSLICSKQKDILVQTLDEKNRGLESRRREAEKAMMDWIENLKSTVLKLEVT